MGCFCRLVVLTIQEEKLVLLLWGELDLIPLECSLLLITPIDKCISALIMVSVGFWYEPYGNAQSSRLPNIGVIFGFFMLYPYLFCGWNYHEYCATLLVVKSSKHVESFSYLPFVMRHLMYLGAVKTVNKENWLI